MTNFTDTMISAKNYEQLIAFYTGFANFAIAEKNDNFVLLKNNITNQVLCITNGISVGQPSAGFKTDDIIKSKETIIHLGGKVLKEWERGDMKGMNCVDSEGNELLVWQGNH